MTQHTDPDHELRGSYERGCYEMVEDGTAAGDRVELRYYSRYSDTVVDVAGTVTDVGAVSLEIELDDGREWGVFGGSIRTAENSRRASGHVDSKNGRPVGFVRELRVYDTGASR